MSDYEKIMKLFENNKSKIFSPKDLADESGIAANKVRNILSKLLRKESIVKVSRGKYQHPTPAKVLPKEHIKRYISALEKTCEIAIHELMLTESLVGKKDKAEIEHQIVYFARHLVKARWELDKGPIDSIDINEEIFKRARKIHDWSKMVFEESLEK